MSVSDLNNLVEARIENIKERNKMEEAARKMNKAMK